MPETKTLTCRCGACQEAVPKVAGGIVAIIEAAPGWSFVWYQATGLSPQYLCPSCTEKALAALRMLQEVIGDLTYINFLPMLRRLS